MIRPNSTHATRVTSGGKRAGAKRGEPRLTSAYHKTPRRAHEELVEIMLRLAREDRNRQTKEETR